MPLSAANMFPGGPVKSADAIEYFNLLTGAMTDQPVTLANTLTAGGSHGVGSVPFRVNGVAAQTANMQEVRALGTDVSPIFAIGPDGTLKWGPGGGVATDTTLRRSGAGVLQASGLTMAGLTVSSGVVDFTGASSVLANLPRVVLTSTSTALSGGAGTWQDLAGTTTSVPAGTYLGIITGAIATGVNADSPTISLALGTSNSGGSGLVIPQSLQINVAANLGTGAPLPAGIAIVSVGVTANYKLQMFSGTATSTAVGGCRCVLVRIA